MSMPNCVPQSPTWFRRNTLGATTKRRRKTNGQSSRPSAGRCYMYRSHQGIHQEQHMLHVKQDIVSIHTEAREGTTFMSAKLSEATEGVADDG